MPEWFAEIMEEARAAWKEGRLERAGLSYNDTFQADQDDEMTLRF